jgi:outer membrane lipoprotein-sorting protein
MDVHKTFNTISYTAVMTIHIGDKVRKKSMTARALGESKALAEFTNPEDKGTKYLKLEKNLWIYFPEEQDVVKISGHMLKEGMMGSDISYEDALESDGLLQKYEVTIQGEEKLNKRDCYVLMLKAKVKRVSYHRRRMWVDKKTFLPMKEEMYAKSGKLLKESLVLETRPFGKRLYPVKTVMADKLRKNSKTVFEMNRIQFDKPMDKKIFSIRHLQR